jgi:acetyl-CoA carboxylase carboxyltransferase component
MGPQAAVNAVYYNKIREIPDGPERKAFVAKLRDEYRADIDILRLASDLIVDAVVSGDRLRDEIGVRLDRAAGKRQERAPKKHLVPPV